MTVVMKGNPAGGDTPQDQHSTHPVPPQQQSSAPKPSEAATATGEVTESDISIEMTEEPEPVFPVAELAHLDEMINRPRWVVPVLPKGELEVLLDTAIKLCREGNNIYI